MDRINFYIILDSNDNVRYMEQSRKNNDTYHWQPIDRFKYTVHF